MRPIRDLYRQEKNIVQNKFVVFTADLNHPVRQGIARIDDRIPELSWLIVCQRPRRRLRYLVRNQWSNLKRNGWRWIPYQLADLWERLARRHDRPVLPGVPGYECTLAALESNPRVRIEYVDDLHATATQNRIGAFAPMLGLALAAPILRESVFSLPKMGTINLHKGRVPDYRGMPPAFWEFWNDEPEVGCTVHWVDKMLDRGDVVAQTSLPREKYGNVRGMQLRLDEAGVELMAEAVEDILAGSCVSSPQPPNGRTNRKPTLLQVAQLERRLSLTQPVAAPPLRRAAKDVAARAAHTFWRTLGRFVLRPRITVLLYHRVTDEVRDNLTVGIDQFDRQMKLVKRFCDPLNPTSIVDRSTIERSDRPLVIVTFDDGYLDNYEHAVPILRRHGIPAAFFVTTRLIGTNEPFPHDLRRGNEPIPKMDWRQLRQMRDFEFTIGSHSCSHIDCASESEATVRAELAESRGELYRELRLDDQMFAYPYGGREHMTAERLQLVKDAGYSACLSAYGGVNVGRIDRFNVLRKGINWEFSDRAFLFECLGLR